MKRIKHTKSADLTWKAFALSAIVLALTLGAASRRLEAARAWTFKTRRSRINGFRH